MTKRPKKHKLIVEVTDMSGTSSTRRIASQIRDIILNYRQPYHESNDFVNVQVKDARRVAAAKPVLRTT